MRLIDADKTLETLEGLTELVIGEGAALVKALTFAALKSESVVPTVGGWISVKDRLPTSIVNKVLVWLEHEYLNGYIGSGHYEKYKGQEIWYDLEHNEAFAIRGYTVAYWQDLPEPPKEVEE